MRQEQKPHGQGRSGHLSSRVMYLENALLCCENLCLELPNLCAVMINGVHLLTCQRPQSARARLIWRRTHNIVQQSFDEVGASQ
jgi:hypothetical protein